MTALSIQPTFPIFTDIDGQPLEDGYVFIGTANLPPITNPITAYWDAALTLPAAQPIRTRGGYPINSGTPARLYVNSDYSIQVQNKNGSLIYSAPAATDRFSDVVVQDISSTEVTFVQAGTGAVTRTAQAKMRDVVSVKDFGAVGNGVADDTAAFNAVIAYANAKGGNDRANIIGSTIFIPEGRYRITAALNPITVSSVYFVGASKGSAVILSTSPGGIFTFGDSTRAITAVGGGVSSVKIEYPSGPTSNATAFIIDYAFSLVFQDLMLENIGTLLSLGQSASRIAGGITVTNVQGSISNLGYPLFNLKYGAGLTVSDCGIFVRGVLAPVHPAPMTTVYGTNVFKCDVGFWDTLEVSNCLFERFDVGVSCTSGAGMVYQNFLFSNVIFDYFRRWCVYAECNGAGGVISTFKFSSTCWFVSWEEDAIALIRTNGFHDNHSISGTIPIAGKYGIKYQINNGETNSFQNIQVNGCNRLGTVASCLYFAVDSRGFSVTNVKGNNDATIGWTRPDYGIVVLADCDEYIVNGCALEGPVGGYSFAVNASGSSQRRAFNNVKANYAGYSGIGMPASGVQYVNTTPFVQEWSFFGGTITSGYDKNGQGFPGGLQYVHFRLQPNDNFTCGYSVAPTVRMFVEP